MLNSTEVHVSIQVVKRRDFLLRGYYPSHPRWLLLPVTDFPSAGLRFLL